MFPWHFSYFTQNVFICLLTICVTHLVAETLSIMCPVLSPVPRMFPHASSYRQSIQYWIKQMKEESEPQEVKRCAQFLPERMRMHICLSPQCWSSIALQPHPGPLSATLWEGMEDTSLLFGKTITIWTHSCLHSTGLFQCLQVLSEWCWAWIPLKESSQA